MASEGKGVDLGPGQLEVPGDPLTGESHELVLLIRVDERIALHRVVHRVGVRVISPPQGGGEKVGGVGHALHAPHHDPLKSPARIAE